MDVLKACVIACALDYFGMDAMDGVPTKNKPLPPTMLTKEMQSQWVMEQAHAILNR
jgi:hypothetical protein